MFEINNNTIYITRGDKATINLEVEKYAFKAGDKVAFCVYEKSSLNKSPVLRKIINVEKEAENLDIELNSEDTRIGEMSNKEIEYWYEIELNDNQTLLGYDDEGAKILILYPEGAM